MAPYYCIYPGFHAELPEFQDLAFKCSMSRVKTAQELVTRAIDAGDIEGASMLTAELQKILTARALMLQAQKILEEN